MKDRGAGWNKVPTTTERRDVFRGKDCGVVHTQYNSTARLWRYELGLHGRLVARRRQGILRLYLCNDAGA